MSAKGYTIALGTTTHHQERMEKLLDKAGWKKVPEAGFTNRRTHNRITTWCLHLPAKLADNIAVLQFVTQAMGDDAPKPVVPEAPPAVKEVPHSVPETPASQPTVSPGIDFESFMVEMFDEPSNPPDIGPSDLIRGLPADL
jgi:hypothetical protein